MAGCTPSWPWCCWWCSTTGPASTCCAPWRPAPTSTATAGSAGSTNCPCCCSSRPWCWWWSSHSDAPGRAARAMHKTSAWPLALIYAALIVFASLFPFEGWREQGISPWVFFTARIPPPYWTWFDINLNLAGYAPFGFLLALALLRTGWPRAAMLVTVLAALAGALLSLAMEYLQIFLPRRVPSNMDLALNAAGALAGALAAALLERVGAIARWSRFRESWFVPQARGALVLLALWPWALLFPAALPFGLGQVWDRLEAALTELLEDTPFLDWLPVREPAIEPLSPGGELLAVALGLLIPCLLGYCIMRHMGRRALLALSAAAIGIAATALSSLLSYG